MTTLLLLGLGYFIALGFILAILTTAKRGDEDMARRRAQDLAEAPWVFAHAPTARPDDDVVRTRNAPQTTGSRTR